MTINIGDSVRVKREFRKQYLVNGATGLVVGILDIESEVPWLAVEIPNSLFGDTKLICVQADELELMAWRDDSDCGGIVAG